MAAPEAEVARPDNFLDHFNQLSRSQLIKLLRFLPPHDLAHMRLVSRRFYNVITDNSEIMSKKERNGPVVLKCSRAGQFSVEWFSLFGSIIKTLTTKLTGDNVPLSELLRFIHIDGLMYFGEGLSAADKVLDQLSEPWLSLRPEVVIFAGDLSQTSQESLRAFLVKVEPSVRRLHFQNANNLDDSLLSDDLIGAAGRLDGLMLKPMSRNSELPDIGDETLLSMVDADYKSSYFSVTGCSGITPGGIRAFIEKWIKKERPKTDADSFSFELGCELTFYMCANVTPAAVEEACGDLLKKEIVDENEENEERVCYTIQCPSSNCRLKIFFHYSPLYSHFVSKPKLDDEDESIDVNLFHHSVNLEAEDNDIDDYDRNDAIDYDGEEDSDLS